jgi:hypothetical protein
MTQKNIETVRTGETIIIDPEKDAKKPEPAAAPMPEKKEAK